MKGAARLGIEASVIDSTVVSRSYEDRITEEFIQEGETTQNQVDFNSNISYFLIEEFNETDYLNVTATTASGWGSGSIQPGLEGLDDPIYKDTTGSARDVYVIENYAYLADMTGLAIINISDPTNPGDPIYRNTAGEAFSVYVSGNYAYVCGFTSHNYDHLAIIDISNPTNPGDPIYANTTGLATNVYVSGDYAYVANVGGLAIINISDPTNPGAPIYRDTTGYASDVYVSENYAYVANGESGLAIINISDPTNPGSPIYRNILGEALSVHVSGNYAYICDFSSYELAIIDISDPTNPGIPIYRDTTGFASNVYVNDNYVYVANGESGLAIAKFEWSSPSIVQSAAYYTGEGFVQKVTVYANQTVFSNTSINYQLSCDGRTWIPINLNESYFFPSNPSHGLYWRAILEAEDLHDPLPQINSLTITYDVYYDEEPPSIRLLTIPNNTALCPDTIIEMIVSDYLLDQCWFSWDEGDNFPLTTPWTISCPPLEEGYHWLIVNAADSVGHQTTIHYRFYVNYPPSTELTTLQNNSSILPTVSIELSVLDPTLITVWYHWDDSETITLSSPFLVQAINSSGWHVLVVEAWDSWNAHNVQTFNFYILGPASVEAPQHPPTTAYSGESFVYSFTITNPETIPLNLLVLAIGTEDDVLSGNNTQIILDPGENNTVEIEIRPKHASIHQLEIYLLHNGLVYYHKTLKFRVAPQWMSPAFLLPILLVFIFLLILILISGTSLFYIRDQLLLRRLFWEQQEQLLQLIDQLTIANLEEIAHKEVNDSNTPDTQPLGFPQHLQLAVPLDREVLKEQFYALKAQIINGDPINLNRLADLLAQCEELLN